MKILHKDFPFTVIVEDKIGRTSGKLYRAISVGYTSIKNRAATNPEEKYTTTWLNFVDPRDLLKLAAAAETAYNMQSGTRPEKEDAPF
jgi:hypothetical protein